MKRGFLNSKKAKALEHDVITKTSSIDMQSLRATLPSSSTVAQGPLRDIRLIPVAVSRDGTMPTDIHNHIPADPLRVTTLPPRTNGMLPNFPEVECMISTRIKERILFTPGFPQDIPRIPAGEKLYIIKSVPKKGLGIFATRDIAPAELICAERPLMITTRGMVPYSLHRRPMESDEDAVKRMIVDQETYLGLLFSRMSDENQKAFLALTNSHLNDGSGPLGGRVRTNSFGVTDALAGKDAVLEEHIIGYAAVLNDLSRLNHSCSPNTDYNFDVASLSMRFRAARPIKSGEEITTTYCPCTRTASARQTEIEHYGFKCICHSCLNSKTSDPKRLYIAQDSVSAAVKSMPKDKKYKPGKAWFEKALKSLRYHDEEGLESLPSYRDLLFQIFKAYFSRGDAENAAKYGSKLLVAHMVSGRDKTDEIEAFGDVGRIKSHEAFGTNVMHLWA